VTADGRTFEPDPANTEGVRTFLSKYLPTALGPEIYTKTCLYTLTPDRDFVIDAVPESEGVYLAIGAGHAFKFASVIGKTLSELAIDGRTEVNLTPFTIERPILKEKHPAKSYMV
jgi:sarcosine oxidase